AVGAERQVEHADVQAGIGTVRDHPVDRGEHLGDMGEPVRVGDLDADDARVGGHADEVGTVTGVGAADRGVVAPGDDPGDVGPVTEGVEVGEVGRLGLEGQVGTVDHLPVRAQPVHRGDAGVDDRDVDAL